jgi:hypothetical protein
MCGHEYDKAIFVVMGGKAHTFDCFECAIYSLAPLCARCGCRVVGRGLERQSAFYCSAHCANSASAAGHG